MSDERTEVFCEPRVSIDMRVSDDRRNSDTTGTHKGAPEDGTPARRASDHATPDETTPEESARDTDHESPASEVSKIKIGKHSRLPALDDDADVGVQKEHVVTRDGKADLRFTGVLLASAAPASAPQGRWQEYRIYQTIGDKHVFSKVTRSVLEGREDAYEAEVYDPSPASVPSQLIRSAREIARARPLTWMDAAVAFFGYEPLAKELYRKLSVRFEEQIS
jgi:hypothetical protein